VFCAALKVSFSDSLRIHYGMYLPSSRYGDALVELCKQCVRLMEYPSEYDATDDEEVAGYLFFDQEEERAGLRVLLLPLPAIIKPSRVFIETAILYLNVCSCTGVFS